MSKDLCFESWEFQFFIKLKLVCPLAVSSEIGNDFNLNYIVVVAQTRHLIMMEEAPGSEFVYKLVEEINKEDNEFNI